MSLTNDRDVSEAMEKLESHITGYPQMPKVSAKRKLNVLKREIRDLRERLEDRPDVGQVIQHSEHDRAAALMLDDYKARSLACLLQQVRGTPLDTGDWCGVLLRMLTEAGYEYERDDISDIEVCYASRIERLEEKLAEVRKVVDND